MFDWLYRPYPFLCVLYNKKRMCFLDSAVYFHTFHFTMESRIYIVITVTNKNQK